jgi:hypothetical protein
MNTNYGYQEVSVKDLFDDATGVPDSLQAVPKERWNWSSMPAKDPILELVGNLRGRGICYPAVKNGKSTVEGILLTTAPVERIVERVRSVCEEHFLSYEHRRRPCGRLSTETRALLVYGQIWRLRGYQIFD